MSERDGGPGRDRPIDRARLASALADLDGLCELLEALEASPSEVGRSLPLLVRAAWGVRDDMAAVMGAD